MNDLLEILFNTNTQMHIIPNRTNDGMIIRFHNNLADADIAYELSATDIEVMNLNVKEYIEALLNKFLVDLGIKTHA